MSNVPPSDNLNDSVSSHPVMPPDRRSLLAGIGGLAAGALIAGRAQAGPLNPPAGPVTSTGKTLTEVEPRIAINAVNTPGDADSLFRISQPGSYYLTGNVAGVSGKHGIKITASGVTIDLNGFALAGSPGSLDGIKASASDLQAISVFNGTVRGWGGRGIDLFTSLVCGGRLDRVSAFENAGMGISVGINYSVTHCSSCNNPGGGIEVGAYCTVSHCSADLNLSVGILSGGASTISHCTSSSNSFAGIEGGTGSAITHCISSGNRGVGIKAGFYSSVTHCVSDNNGTHGIEIRESSLVSGNHCPLNGSSGGTGSGIRATGGDTRIESNNCVGNRIGIECVSGGNYIARNTCSGNSNVNWSLAAGNVCLIVNAATAGAVSGSSGGTAPGSTDPNANFSY